MYSRSLTIFKRCSSRLDSLHRRWVSRTNVGYYCCCHHSATMNRERAIGRLLVLQQKCILFSCRGQRFYIEQHSSSSSSRGHRRQIGTKQGNFLRVRLATIFTERRSTNTNDSARVFMVACSWPFVGDAGIRCFFVFCAFVTDGYDIYCCTAVPGMFFQVTDSLMSLR